VENTGSDLRQASTVILVRERNEKIEIYLLRRSASSGFMGGLYVFPGGVVDPEDRDFKGWSPFLDLGQEDIDKKLGADAFWGEDVLGFSIAAIRETLEEAGVLIAVTENKVRAELDYICEYRLSKELARSWFREKIMEKKLILALSHLNGWSHWITPKLMKKRFDTRFFMVFMPEGQSCRPDDKETEHGIWLTPQKALELNLELTVPLSPPTIVTLTELLQYNTLEDLRQELKKRTWGEAIAPQLVPSSNGPVILEPWDSQYSSDSKINIPQIDTKKLHKKILPSAYPFSRLWCDRGVWKPVAL
jgi:8-oxo-dGTP pyrophosphatase MutT (NUDIX family)